LAREHGQGKGSSLVSSSLISRQKSSNRFQHGNSFAFFSTVPADFLQADEGAALRTRKFQTNRLLNRKQFVVDILHPTKPNLSKDEVRTRLSSTHKVPKETVQTFGFRTQFGGGKSTGFALIYDSETDLKKFEVPPPLIVNFPWPLPTLILFRWRALECDGANICSHIIGK